MAIQSIPSEENEIVLIDKKPRKVFVEKRGNQVIHYFYWLWDLYRPFDYEPVKVEEINGDTWVLTRFHWKGLVIFTSPRLINGKPLLSFARGVHTPLVYSSNWLFHIIFCLKELDLEQQLWLTVYINILRNLSKKGLTLNNLEKFKGYKELLSYDPVPDRYKFRLDTWDYLIIVGKYPLCLLKEIEERLKACD